MIPVEKNITSTGTKEPNCTQEENNISEINTLHENTILLKSIDGETYNAVADDNHFTIHDIKYPIVLINFFSTWCPPCRGQIPYFEDLQKKYGKELFLTGILVNDDSNASELEKFYDTYHAHYFISNGGKNNELTEKVVEALKLDENFTLPLTVLYKNGEYYTHYEGAVPVEMIDHDIRTALEKN